MIKRILSLFILSTLAACGGGEADAKSVAISLDNHTYKAPFGVQDRVLGELVYTNSTASNVSVVVSISSVRTVKTPLNLSGTTDVRGWISILNVTKNQLVGSSQDWDGPDVARMSANKTATYSEYDNVTVVVPPGQTYVFRSYTRVYPKVGSSGLITLRTADFRLELIY